MITESFPPRLYRLAVVMVALAIAMLVLLAGNEPAAADRVGFDCDSIVVDYGTKLGDATPVVIAATDAEKFGPVRIRVWDSTPGSLDDELASAALDCGWVAADGSYVGDLLVIAISIDEKSTLVNYGPGWAPSLDDSIDTILNRIMNPQFGEGAYTAGLSVGLEQMAARRGDVEGTPRETTTVAPTTAAPGDGQTETTVAPESTDPDPDTTFLLPQTATTIDTPVVDVPDAIEEEPAPTSVVAGGEDEPNITAAPEPSTDEQAVEGEAQLVPNIDQDGSGMGVYLLIAGVLAAVFVVPLVLLKRGQSKPGEGTNE